MSKSNQVKDEIVIGSSGHGKRLGLFAQIVASDTEEIISINPVNELQIQSS